MTQSHSAISRPDEGRAGAGPLGVFSWCLYDWANSAFGTLVTTFIFAPYFISQVAESPTEGTVLWGQTSSLAALCVALLSPPLGAIADKGGRRKVWLLSFTGACAFFACGLYWVEPSSAYVILALCLFALAAIASDVSLVFYNAMLPTLVPRDRIGRVSGWGWSLGYFGGIFSLAATLFLFVGDGAPLASLDTGKAEAVRATVFLAAGWYVLFALPLFFFTPERRGAGLPARKAIAAGFKTLWRTFAEARRYGTILRFLIAFLFYANGFVTLFAFGGIYAAGTFGMTMDEVIAFGIALNVAAGLGAVAFGWVDDRIGPKRTILIALSGLVLSGSILVLTDSKSVLWALGIVLGLFVGPAQSASRSFMARLAPKAMENEMFGLYALSGKATAFAGPLAMAFFTDIFESQRAGMASILLFFACGFVLLLPVREPRE
jgi:UMF1 family MFS transporter